MYVTRGQPWSLINSFYRPELESLEDNTETVAESSATTGKKGKKDRKKKKEAELEEAERELEAIAAGNDLVAG